MDKGWIPRNLIEKDVIKFGMGISLSLGDMPFMAAGAVLAYTASTFIPSLIFKVVMAFLILALFYVITKISVEGQKAPELCVNGSMYAGRQVYYNKKRKELQTGNKKSGLFKNLSLKAN